jgi:translation initiation factor 1A
MVKNTTGGGRTKGQARKFLNSSKQPNNLRLSNDDDEVYAQVTKILGNGMCHVLCIDKQTRLCHIRGKFRGRSKRDNIITNNGWILVGLREWENKDSTKMQNCDLLEVYSQLDVDRLKNTVDENWNIFNNHSTSNVNNSTEDTFDFIDDKTSEYMELIEKQFNEKNNQNEKIIEFSIIDDEIDINDI